MITRHCSCSIQKVTMNMVKKEFANILILMHKNSAPDLYLFTFLTLANKQNLLKLKFNKI